jgi:hypothetical protein
MLNGCQSVASNNNDLGSLAHKLGNSLGIIFAGVSLLEIECSKASPEVVTTLKNEIEISKSLIQQLRSLAAVQAK